MGNSKYLLKISTRQNKKQLLVNGHRLIQRQLDNWLEIIEYLHEMENTDFSAETEKQFICYKMVNTAFLLMFS